MAKLLDQAKNAGMNSDATVLAKMKRLSELKKHPELENVFSIQPEILASIIESMKKNGYDKAQPIVLGKIDGEWYIVDGYTRREAAEQAGIYEVPVDNKEFENLEAAIHYCFRRQAERRNLSQSEIYNAAVKLNIPVKELAKELGVCESSITRAKKIEREADPEDITAIKNNKKTINDVYNNIKKSKPKNNHQKNNTGEIPEDENSELKNIDENQEKSANDPDGGIGDISDNAAAESETSDFDTDILDGAIIESETSETHNYDETAQIIMDIVNLLSENGETSAITIIQNAYPNIFN